MGIGEGGALGIASVHTDSNDVTTAVSRTVEREEMERGQGHVEATRQGKVRPDRGGDQRGSGRGGLSEKQAQTQRLIRCDNGGRGE